MHRPGYLPTLRRCLLRLLGGLVRRSRARRDPGRGGRRPRKALAQSGSGPLAAPAHGGPTGRRARTPFTLYWREECACWWVQFVVNGKRHRKSTASADRGAASERAAAIWQEAKARAGEPAAPGSVTRPLRGIADDLLRRVLGHGRAPTYVRDLEVDLRLHILPRWNAAEAVTSLAWEEAREELHEGMSWSSVRRVGKHLRTLLRHAKQKGAIRSVPEIRSPPRELIVAEAKEWEPFTRKERDRLLADMRRRGNLWALRCYEVMFFNLFRKSTVQRLMPSWFDWTKRTIRVPASKAKNSKTRIYWLHPRAEKAIKTQIKENADAASERGRTEDRKST